jgi:hypothetical protein
MATHTDILLEEWKDIRETLRYFGNKRFAQLTVFIAVSGFMFDSFLKRPGLNRSWLVPGVGMVFGVLFIVMETSSVRYWRKFAERGKTIEQDIGHLELMSRFRPANRLFTSTNATYMVYLGVVLLWFFLLLTGM